MSRVQAVRTYFEALQPGDVARMGELYADQAFFRDPFNEVRGLAAVQRIFAHMFESVEAPRFVVRDAFEQGDQGFLTWDFHFVAPGRPMLIHGSSHVRFDLDGKVLYHRDYWDAAEELWEKLPVLGPLLRLLKKRLRAH